MVQPFQEFVKDPERISTLDTPRKVKGIIIIRQPWLNHNPTPVALFLDHHLILECYLTIKAASQ